MKILKDILYRTPILDTVGNTGVSVSTVAFDSRDMEKEGLFVAIQGTLSDGHKYIDQAIEKGATSIVCEKMPEVVKDNITYIKVKDSHLALGLIASNFYDNPSSELELIAITGTNGKTTTASLLHQLFTDLGLKSGLLSTVTIKIGAEEIPATHTTPDPVNLNRHLRKMIDEGCSHCFMEASSHGIVQRRTAGLNFTGAIFTNITHDHLDYHGSFDEYIKAKKTLFDELPKTAFALVNGDDRNGQVMLQNTKARKYTYGLRSDADYKCRILEQQFTGMLLQLDQNELWTRLIGKFNAYNLLAVYASAVLLGQDELEVATGISNLEAVEGRFQYFRSPDGKVVIVDYAHTPDALENVLTTINDIRGGHEKLITVVGCGGDRDKAKRPEMARIATEYSGQVIFTSDNPRSEDPDNILEDMITGVQPQHSSRYLCITNRKEAIKAAVRMAGSEDIILIAGKGHEKYQEINGEKLPFDDLKTAVEFLKQAQG